MIALPPARVDVLTQEQGVFLAKILVNAKVFPKIVLLLIGDYEAGCIKANRSSGHLAITQYIIIFS